MSPQRTCPLLGCLSLAASLVTLTAHTPAQAPPAPSSVSAAECGRCHEREMRRLQGRGHGLILQVDVLSGCETCHGPGRAHAEHPDNDPSLISLPSSLEPREQAALCASCHGDQIERHGGDPAGFRIAGYSCTDCHSVHGRQREPEAPGLRFSSRAAANAHAEAVGSAECAECHPLRDSLLAISSHAEMAAAHDDSGCERCHGAGSLHVENGAGRLITRPDRAQDGIATCRSCHDEVDADEFHWVGRDKPYLSEGITCTTCHIVHAPATAAATTPAAATPTNRLCATCHASAFSTMPGSTHQLLGNFDTPLDEGCGACHQGSREHAASGGKPGLLVQWLGQAQLEAEVCMSCHQNDAGLRHARHGDHLRNGVSCTDCHGPLHGAPHGKTQQTAEQNCAACHQDVAAEFMLPNHHPVPEHQMYCSSCHDVHGASKRVSDLALTERKCVSCHQRYAGPFVFEHEAGRRQGCVICHLPHGSSNRRLMREASTQQNCLQCHGDFPAFHDQTPGAVFTNCIRCHTQVHGSDHSRYFFR